MSNSSECGQDQLAINTASTANDTKVICDEIVWKSNLDRKSHVPFFEQRDWDSVIAYWGSLLVNPLPPSISSPSEYTLTDLRTIHEIGKEEFSCSDPRYKRKTFAMRIGYNGCQYNGFQKQKGAIGVYTVEDDIQLALERSTVAAGRTDKDVSAVSQVISFSTYEDIDEDFLMEKFNSSSGARAGRLVAYDCARVPKRFHSLFSATWRRYIFYFPLNYGNYHGVDVDVEFVRLCLSK